MSYGPPLAAALSGASTGRLSYWRHTTPQRGPLLVPEYGSRPRVNYSFRDIIALRMFVQLRETVSLQRIRKAVEWLQENHPDTHLSVHRLLADPGGETIVWISANGDYFDVVQRPGQQGFAVVMQNVLHAFQARGRLVPDLIHPARGIAVDPEVRGGFPVVEGTRIPFTAIAGLTRDGLNEEEIAGLYPAVTAEAVVGASELAFEVAGNGKSLLAA